jgi:hypothetical protein
MTIAATITALQTLHLTLTTSGVKTAPTTMPSNLNTATMPIVLVWPGEADWRAQAVGLKRQQREYIVRCFVAPVAQDLAGPVNHYATCNTLLEAFGRAYLADVSLGNKVDSIATIVDSGVSGGTFDLTWAGVSYWGFVFRLGIVEKSA